MLRDEEQRQRGLRKQDGFEAISLFWVRDKECTTGFSVVQVYLPLLRSGEFLQSSCHFYKKWTQGQGG